MRVLIVTASILSIAYAVVGAVADSRAHDGPLWDLDYYRAAAERWSRGADPYLSGGSQTGYYYSLAVTPLLARVFLDFEAELLYFVVMLAGIAAALLLSVRAARPPPGQRIGCWLLAVAFGGGEVVYLLATGNLAWLVALVQGGALLAASRRSWPIFYILVGFASLIKPYSLALLVLPLALKALSAWTAVALLPLVIDTLVTRALWPNLVESKMAAIWIGVIEPLQLRYSLTGRLSRILVKLDLEVATATTIALLVQLGIVALMVLALRRQRPENDRLAFALAVLAAFAAIPRMAGYDALIYGPAILVAFWTSAEISRSRTARGFSVAGLLVGVLKEGLAVLPIVGLCIVMLLRRVWPTTSQSLSTEPPGLTTPADG